MKIQKTSSLNKDFCLIASTKMYAVLNQDGAFSATGFHVEGRMSGIFSQPNRISSGYKIIKNDAELKAKSYTINNGQGIFDYGDFTVTADALDDERVFTMFFDGDIKDVTVELDVSIEGCWTGEQYGYADNKTVLLEKATDYAIYRHMSQDCCVMVRAIDLCGSTFSDKIATIELRDGGRIVIAVSNTAGKLKERINKLNYEDCISSQQRRREELLVKTRITTGNVEFDKAFESLKLNYDMLIQDIDGIGEGYTTGCPDYMWFFGCDTVYGSLGTLAVGQTEMTKQSLRLIKNLSDNTNGNGRVIHEVSSFGLVYNKGNLQETPHFVDAVYEVYHHTDDKEFLNEMLPFCLDGMKWAESTIEDGSLCPKGAGIVEVPGIEGRVIDIAIMMINAYSKLAFLCNASGMNDRTDEFTAKAGALKQEVLEKFYCPDEEFFADIICTYNEIVKSRDQLVNSIKNTKSMTEALDKYFDKLLSKSYEKDELIPVVLKNWVTILPYAEDFVPEDIKKKGLAQMRGAEFYNDYGMKLACRCDDKNDPVSDMYTLNKAMSINTGYLAEVFAKNGDADTAFDLLLKLAKTLEVGMPGAISETLPDDGCFMQLWSGYGIHHVFTRHILGITPDAPNKRIIIKPNLPKTLERVTVENFSVGECMFDISMTRNGENVDVTVKKSIDIYNVILEV